MKGLTNQWSRPRASVMFSFVITSLLYPAATGALAGRSSS
jgi:hypothetical protein